MVVQSYSLRNLEVNSHAMVLAMRALKVAQKKQCVLHRTTRPVYSRIFLACLSLLASQVVYAEGEDTFKPYVGYGIFSGDNIAKQPETGNVQSDTWTRATAGFRFDKTISRQHVSVDASLNKTDYDKFSEFDNDGRKLRANWNWVVGNRLSGNIGTSFVESVPLDFDAGILGQPQQGVLTQKRSFINGGWHFHPSWRITAGFTRYDLDYEVGNVNDSQVDTAELGLDYVPKSGNKIGLLLRHGEGDNPNLDLGNTANYTQDEVKANINWQITGKTNLQFLGGWAQRDYEFIPSRNYSGLDARLTANWAVTGKTDLTLAVWRALGSGYGDQTVNANNSVNTGASMSANWQATNKISVDALTSTEDRDYSGIVDRTDEYRRSSIGLNYLPLKQWSFRLAAYQQRLKSNFITPISYRSEGIQLSTRYEF